MKPKSIWKNTGVRVWIIVCSIVMALIVTATIVVAQVPFLYNTINSVVGGERRVLSKGDPSQYMRYEADYTLKSETLAAANALNEKICEEGIILMKNEDDALPLAGGAKVSVFGRNSIDLVLGGSGSSAGSGNGDNAIDLYSSLTNADFDVNPTMKSFYSSSGSRPATPGMGSILTGYPIAETPLSAYTSAVKSSYAQYSDAAIVVISRIGGEGYDLPRTMFWNGSKYTTWSGTETIPGARSKDDHYLQLDQNETDMLSEACNNFEKVIVVINCSTSMELGFLDDPNHYAYNPKIKAALWIGNPGKSGINALGKVLKGDVNPSGKTIDTYARNFKKDPTWNNFGNNLVEFGNRYMVGESSKNAYFVQYEEGIYVGYRYYETRGAIDGNDWYKANVVYPFGHGLSYTTFDWSMGEAKLSTGGTTITADSVFEVDVTVTNTGDVDGKEVVQLYYTPPYTLGGIEKAHVVLGDFVKTKELAPNESQTLKLKVNVRSMASYDYNDANINEYVGYELESGNYEFKVMNNAHNVFASVGIYNVSEGIKYENDSNTGKKINNLFDDVSENISTYLSRADFDGTMPIAPTVDERKVSSEFISTLTYKLNDKVSDPYYSETAPTQSSRELSRKKTKVKLYDLVGKDFDDPLWDTLLDQLTVEQMKGLISKGNFRTVNIDNIDKPLTIDADGPMGFAIFMGDPSVYDTCYYASECVIGATWNAELAYEMGKMVGNEGLIGNEKGDGRTYSGWYAPAINMHRSQFGGRNFEYYSEDGFFSGRMASAVIKGAKEKGVYTYVKHFALNDQETNRDTTGLITWANEQSMRELYFLPFEMAVKEGKTTAMMSAFNRLGATWAGGNHTLLTELLRNEWGFEGMVITDFNLTPYMNVDQMIRAGGDLNLSPGKDLSSDGSATSVTAIRKSAHNILYTVANSNAMNGMGSGVEYRYALPIWLVLLISGDCILFALSGLWGTLVILKALKKTKQSEINIPIDTPTVQ